MLNCDTGTLVYEHTSTRTHEYTDFMLRLLLRWVANAVALIIVSQIVPGITVNGFAAALWAALVIGLVNATLGLLLKILTFPLTILTLGLFWFVINAIMLELASAFVPGFHVAGFLSAFFGAIVLALVNVLLKWLVREVTEGTCFVRGQHTPDRVATGRGSSS